MATIDSEAVLAYLRILAPEFSATSDDDALSVIGVAKLRIATDAFGSFSTEAASRLAAHWLTLQARAESMSIGSAGVGPVNSVRSGDLSLGFAGSGVSTSSLADAELLQTSHGLAFLALRAEMAGGTPALIA